MIAIKELPPCVEPQTIPTSMKTYPALFALLSTLALGPFTAGAQSYQIDKFNITGGGGTSVGGPYSVRSAIGQPSAGTMSGGRFSVVSGFWGVPAVVQTYGAPLLTLTRSNTDIIMSWPLSAPGFVLDDSPTLIGSSPPWVQVQFPSVTNATTVTVTMPAPTGIRFYRLRKP